MLWALIGFALGAALPVGYGIHLKYQFRDYVASLPEDVGICGMPVLGYLALMFVGGPFCGLIGAASGLVAAAINDWWTAIRT